MFTMARLSTGRTGGPAHISKATTYNTFVRRVSWKAEGNRILTSASRLEALLHGLQVKVKRFLTLEIGHFNL
jgi:hypothetical protein